MLGIYLNRNYLIVNRYQVWKCILWLGDGSRCALLQGAVEPQTKWESPGPKPFLYSPASEECYTSRGLDLGDALRQLASNFSAPTKEPISERQ